MASAGRRPAGTARRNSDKNPGYHMAFSVVQPASRSMHETSLYKPNHQWTMPEIRGLSTVEQALKCDALHQSKKYGSTEPSHMTARFNVPLPRSPQHNKFSRPSSRATVTSSRPGSRATPLPDCLPAKVGTTFDDVSAHDQDLASGAPSSLPNGCRFNKHTLQKWFKEIDRDASGVISSREFIVAMRKHPGMLSMFCGINGIDNMPEQEEEHGKDDAQVMREEIYAIKEVLREMGNNSMEMAWTDFVDFFRRTGLLLEYRTTKHDNLNRTTLCKEMEEAERKELENQAEKKYTTRRTAMTKTLTKMFKMEDEEDDEQDLDLPLNEGDEGEEQ